MEETIYAEVDLGKCSEIDFWLGDRIFTVSKKQIIDWLESLEDREGKC